MTEGVLNLLGCSLLLCLVTYCILFSFTLDREREKNFGYGLIVCSTRQIEAGAGENEGRLGSEAPKLGSSGCVPLPCGSLGEHCGRKANAISVLTEPLG
jgi:hypothetical protein